ncbi:MAG: ATP-binding cassette domain-containing protein [Chloroflexi bacterium]|nr:MAG: ATP-binding cassette domain-containing protein [Chloroflexota bacterium]
MPAVEVKNVSKYFGKVEAVKDISFHVNHGEIFGLLGPNGAGKTTLIRIILGLLLPTSGSVAVLGGPMTEEKKHRIGYLPEERGLYEEQKLWDVVVYMGRLKNLSAKKAKERAEYLLKQFDLWEHRHKRLKKLSKGMHQKTQLAVTLIHDPDLIIVDEPFSGLDPVNTELVKNMMVAMRAEGKSIIMSTHQMHQVEALCDRIALINNGRIMLNGPVPEIRRQFADNVVHISGRGSFETLPHVCHAEQQNGMWVLKLSDQISPASFLQILATHSNVEVENFAIAYPDLHEIFIRVVQESAKQP